MMKYEYSMTLVNTSKIQLGRNINDPNVIITGANSEGTTHAEDLAKMGRDGWELISVTPLSDGPQGMLYSVLFTFKRPL